MQFTLGGQGIKITQALRDKVEQKQANVLKYSRQAESLDVVLAVANEKGGTGFMAEATFVEPGNTHHAEATEPDMYTAIDVMFERLAKQVRREKRMKVKGRRAHPRPA